MNGNHTSIRESARWGTFGKDGQGPLRFIIIKDIHDDHLANIIPFIQERIKFYGHNTLQLMLDEQEFRRIKKIRVPFKFG